MLRAEQRDQLHSWRVREHVDRAPPLRIDAGLIRDQSATRFPRSGANVLLLEHVDTRLRACGSQCKMIVPAAAREPPVRGAAANAPDIARNAHRAARIG